MSLNDRKSRISQVRDMVPPSRISGGFPVVDCPRQPGGAGILSKSSSTSWAGWLWTPSLEAHAAQTRCFQPGVPIPGVVPPQAPQPRQHAAAQPTTVSTFALPNVGRYAAPITDDRFVHQFPGLQEQQHDMAHLQQDHAAGSNNDEAQQYVPQQGPTMYIMVPGASQVQFFDFKMMASCRICKKMFEPKSIVCRLPACHCYRYYHPNCLNEGWPQTKLSCHACNGPEGSERLSSDLFTGDTIPGTQPEFVSQIHEAMDNSYWCGVDRETQLRCHHGEHPKRRVCWDGENTGRRFLGCPRKGENKCRFVQWMDKEWPPRFQEVINKLWDEVAKYMTKAEDAQADLFDAIQLRDEVYEEKKALMREKKEWAREKAALIMEKAALIREKEDLQREVNVRAMFAQTACATLQDRIRSEVEEKEMLWIAVLCMFGLMVALLYGVFLKNK